MNLTVTHYVRLRFVCFVQLRAIFPHRRRRSERTSARAGAVMEEVLVIWNKSEGYATDICESAQWPNLAHMLVVTHVQIRARSHKRPRPLAIASLNWLQLPCEIQHMCCNAHVWLPSSRVCTLPRRRARESDKTVDVLNLLVGLKTRDGEQVSGWPQACLLETVHRLPSARKAGRHLSSHP